MWDSLAGCFPVQRREEAAGSGPPDVQRPVCLERPLEAPHHVVPWPHGVLLTSTCRRFYSMWNSVWVSGRVAHLCPPTFEDFISEPGSPPISLSFHCCPLSLCSLICVPMSCLPAPAPFCVCHRISSPACLGYGPAALPGRPPGLPLCGSELAPPPAPLPRPGL